MKSIITEKESCIVREVAETVQKIDNNIFKCGSIIYSAELFNCFENVETLDEITPFKYYYTPEQGFYKNPNWVEPDTSNTFGIPDDVYMAIKEQAIQEVQNELNK